MRSQRWRNVCVCLAMCGLLGLSSIVMGLATQDEAADGLQPWEGRLSALKPTEVSAYFELAEELVDASRFPETTNANELKTLAKQQYGLAGALDTATYGRSACLALADLTGDRLERERYLALAGLLPGRDVMATWSRQPGDETISPSDALVLSEALGWYRQGQGNRALSILQRASDGELLRKYGHLLPGGAERFLEDCKHYTNGKKPTLFEGSVARLLVLESALLAGSERSWSGEVMLSTAAPLIEIDPDRLDEMLGVDVTKPYYVNGAFARVPASKATKSAD